MKKIISVLATMTVLVVGAQAKAGNVVQNGSFEVTTSGLGEINTDTQATSWYVNNGNNSYTFVTSAPSAGSFSSQYGAIGIWTTGNGGLNTITASPDGGNFVVMDGNFPGHNEPINQTFTGLQVGKTYNVGFDYAYGQQLGFDGDTVQHWDVSLGSSPVQSTPDYVNPSHGFSGWSHTTMSFVANATTETLSFAARGNLPVPPFALLDGVTMGVPEPATWAMMIVGIGGIGAVARRRRALALSMSAVAA